MHVHDNCSEVQRRKFWLIGHKPGAARVKCIRTNPKLISQLLDIFKTPTREVLLPKERLLTSQLSSLEVSYSVYKREAILLEVLVSEVQPNNSVRTMRLGKMINVEIVKRNSVRDLEPCNSFQFVLSLPNHEI